MRPVYRLVLIALLSALLLSVQVGLAVIPNVELVSLLILIFAISLPLIDSLTIVTIFTTLQAITWGLGDWVIGYYWIWTLWVLVVYLFRHINKDHADRWAILGGLWGLLFGALFALNHGILYGFNFSIAYWMRGILFDIIHMISNYILILLLFNPLYAIFKRMIRSKENSYESNHKNR